MRSRTDTVDGITSCLSKAINVLFLNSPVTTAIGIVVGCFTKGVADFVLQFMQSEIKVPFLLTIPGGILLMRFFRPHRRYYDENIETARQYLREIQKEGNFTQAEKRQQWRRLVEMSYQKIFETDTIPEEGKNSNTPTPAT